MVKTIDDSNGPLLAALDSEFRVETSLLDGQKGRWWNASAKVESAYSRVSDIAGTPLRDGYHFAQTLVDDDGRPYGAGVNGVVGASSRASTGPFSVYFRGEFQRATAIPDESGAAQQAVAAGDGLPYGWNLRFGSTTRVRMVEAYGALTLADWQLSFGQQTLWWGPDRTTSLILSNNSEAMPMLRLDRVKPSRLPGFGFLGPMRFDLFLAREGGVHYVNLGYPYVLHGTASTALNPAPFLWGLAVTAKPLERLEIGLAHTTIFAGYGRPLTLRTFLHTFSLVGNSQADDPGKRVTEFNFNLRLPGLRSGAVLYTEGMAWDDPLEGKFVGRYAFDPGLYLSQLPRLPSLDLRIEGAYTNLPKLPILAYFYANGHYVQGYTNYGQIMGSWVGREGVGGVATSSWWFTARRKLSVSYRQMVSDPSLFQGGSLRDISATGLWTLRSGIELTAMGQYERWRFPLLSAGPRSNGTMQFQVRWSPLQTRKSH